MDIQIEPYKLADISEMTAIWNSVVEDGLAFPQDQLESPESAQEFFGSQNHCAIARERGSGKVVGLYILHPNNVGRCGHICNASYAVGKEQRGNGIGKLLVEDSLTQAKNLGFRIMQFNAVTVDNKAANKLYPQLGFNLLGTIPQGFRRGKDNFVDINLYYRTL